VTRASRLWLLGVLAAIAVTVAYSWVSAVIGLQFGDQFITGWPAALATSGLIWLCALSIVLFGSILRITLEWAMAGKR
jgi:hypothetical protein